MLGTTTSATATRSTSARSRSSAPRPTCRGSRAEEAEVAIRMIHACGQVEAARHFVFSPGFVAAARDGAAAGAPIFCDAEMVAHGVTRARLPAGNEVDLHAARPAHAPSSRRRSAIRARPPRSNCGASAWRVGGGDRQCADRAVLPARNDARLARRSRRRSSACRSASSARPNRRMRWPTIPTACPIAIVRGRHGRQRHDGGRRQRAGEGRPVNARPAASIGVGTGPGDPGAADAEGGARRSARPTCVAHFAKRGNNSNARAHRRGASAAGA